SLVEEDGPMCLTQCHAFNLHAHMPRAVDRVDPCIRISRMNKNLLVLLEPRVHLIPVESKVAFQCGSIASRFDVSAGRVVSDAILYDQAPANGIRWLL